MSWRAGLGILADVFHAIDRHELEASDRLALKADVMEVFLSWDIDPCGLEDDTQFAEAFGICEQRDRNREA